MIESGELERWTPLYDRGFQSFDGDSNEASKARFELNRQLQEAYKIQLPSGSIPFSEFRREAIRQIRVFLKKEGQSPTT